MTVIRPVALNPDAGLLIDRTVPAGTPAGATWTVTALAAGALTGNTPDSSTGNTGFRCAADA